PAEPAHPRTQSRAPDAARTGQHRGSGSFRDLGGTVVRAVDPRRGRQAGRSRGLRPTHERSRTRIGRVAQLTGASTLSAADLVRQTAARFEAAGLYFGHGTDNAEDEALFLVLHALGWPYSVDDAAMHEDLAPAQLAAVARLVDARIDSRQPAAYLT